MRNIYRSETKNVDSNNAEWSMYSRGNKVGHASSRVKRENLYFLLARANFQINCGVCILYIVSAPLSVNRANYNQVKSARRINLLKATGAVTETVTHRPFSSKNARVLRKVYLVVIYGAKIDIRNEDTFFSIAPNFATCISLVHYTSS